MKKTIKTQQVGEFQIVVGIDKLIPDNHSTDSNSMPKIAELEISKTLAKKEKERAGHFEKMKTAEKIAGSFFVKKAEAEKKRDQAEQVKKTAEVAKNETAVHNCELEITAHCNDITACEKAYHKHDKVYKDQGGAVEVKNQEMKELLPEFNKQQMQVRRDNFVYGMPNANILIDRGTLICMQCRECSALFYLPAGDVFVCSACGVDHSDIIGPVLVQDGKTVEEILAVWLLKEQNEQVTIDGITIDDFRGKQYFYHDGDEWKWSEVITELGVNKNTVVEDTFQDEACELSELTTEQQEEIRLQKLTPEELILEKTDKIQEALSASIKMRNELEITGSTPAEALSQSQEFYNNEIIRLTEIYG